MDEGTEKKAVDYQSVMKILQRLVEKELVAEGAILDLDFQIRNALSIRDPDPQACLVLLDQLKEIKFGLESSTSVMDEGTRKKAVDYQSVIKIFQRLVEKGLVAEGAILDLDFQIRNALSIRDPDPQACLVLLDQLKEIKFTQRLLKKHPDIVITMEKTSRYFGSEANITNSQFQEQAAVVRTKAQDIYNMFQTLFVGRNNNNFNQLYENNVRQFNAFKGA